MTRLRREYESVPGYVEKGASGFPEWISPDGAVRLIHGDCLQALSTLEAKSIDAAVTDPPYGTEDGDGYGRRQNHHPEGRMGAVIANDCDLSCLASSWPFIRRCGVVAVFRSPRNPVAFCIATNNEEFAELVWDKMQPGLGNPVRYQHECIAVFGKPTGETPVFSVLRSLRVGELHPHEKPMAIVIRLCRFVASTGKTILDPYMGSGTTAVACIRTGRKFIGIELEPQTPDSPDYFGIAVKRCQAELDRFPLFEPRKQSVKRPLSLFDTMDPVA